MATRADDIQLTALGVRRINTDTDPEELVLPPASEQRLRRIADWLVQPPPVLREWGLHRYIDGGLRALFRGPPGTGKTMAAIAIGRWSDRPLFHVDRDEIANNYRDLFSLADEEKAILLFDRADADIADLLKKLEPYEGLAILATNRGGNLEPDAVSRLDGIVEFPMPDEAARHELWRKLLASAKLAKSHDIDAQSLAKNYDLSGAEILRSLRTAALLAASEGKPVNMELLKHTAEERLKMRAGV